MASNLFGEPCNVPARLCKKCRKNKPYGDFYLNVSGGGRLRRSTWCKLCCCARYATDPQAAWASAIMSKFGITSARYKAMLDEQGGVCALCGKPETGLDRRRGGVRKLAVDHCHATGKVRALLCSKCNTGLGNFDDDVARLQEAISYLQKHK